MTSFRIDCIRKPERSNTHESITQVGGPSPNGNGRWQDTTQNVVRLIEQKVHNFYTQEGGNVATVGVRTSVAGHKYLQTYADGIWKDNLLALKECG
jgi:hypothetical protein